MHVTVYTDGGCDPNPGPGGWGAVIEHGDREQVLSGSERETTNNRMELTATIEALHWLEGSFGQCVVDLYTDSQYLRRGITEWLDGWVARGWRTKANRPVKNQDLWVRLAELNNVHKVSWRWLKGHAGHRQNERADQLATAARVKLVRPSLSAAGQHERSSARSGIEICVKVSCPSGGRCGWGAVLRCGERTRSLSNGLAGATANAMLLWAAAAALGCLKQPCQVTVYSDASYLIKGASLWIKGWQARGWKTREGKSVANQDGWQQLLAAAGPHQITWALARDGANPEDLACAGELAATAARGA
jgi:ribonuclease HI